MNPKHLLSPLLLTAVAASLAFVPAASAITVTQKFPLNAGADLEARCGASSTVSVPLAAGAQDVRLTSPTVGSVPPNGFGGPGAARIDSVRVLADRIEIAGTGINEACSPVVTKFGDSVKQAVGVEGSYVTRREVVPKVSEGKRARVKPARLADAKWGPKTAWRKLRWKSWGGKTAVATGIYTGRRILPDERGYPQEYFFTFPVRVTLSRPVPCNDAIQYSRIKTTFLKRAHPEIRRQAEPPPGKCLSR